MKKLSLYPDLGDEDIFGYRHKGWVYIGYSETCKVGDKVLVNGVEATVPPSYLSHYQLFL